MWKKDKQIIHNRCPGAQNKHGTVWIILILMTILNYCLLFSFAYFGKLSREHDISSNDSLQCAQGNDRVMSERDKTSQSDFFLKKYPHLSGGTGVMSIRGGVTKPSVVGLEMWSSCGLRALSACLHDNGGNTRVPECRLGPRQRSTPKVAPEDVHPEGSLLS